MFRTTLRVGLLAILGFSIASFAVAQTAKANKDGPQRRWALLIGVDEYAELGKLRFSGADQRALAEQLIATGFPKDQVFLLHDKAAENKYRPFRGNIERQLELVLGLVDDGDLVIVGFSGHGMQLGAKRYLCPADAQLDKLAATSIPLEGIYDRLAQSKATLKLLFVDACRNDLVPAGRRSVAVARAVGDFAGAKEKPPEGIMLLESCGPGQVSIEDEQFQHGVFTHFLLEGLSGKAASVGGTVTLAGLYDYASLQTKIHVARRFNDYQTPALQGQISGPFEIGTALPSGHSITDSIGMKLVLIPPGEFIMGSEESAEAMVNYFNATYGIELKAEGYNREHPKHRVRITRPFYLGTYPVTVGQFRRFVQDADYKTDAEKDGKGGEGYDSATGKWEKKKPEYTWRSLGFEQTDEHPVVNVSWNDAVAFCEWISRKEGKTYRLPTEAEWEYACRAGTTTRYWSGDNPEKLAGAGNVRDATLKTKFPKWGHTIRAHDGYVFTSPVGSYRANPFGLYDMHGNAWQWCADWYGEKYYAASPLEDPIGPDSGWSRVLRGGSWSYGPTLARSAYRSWYAPDDRDTCCGFRVARTL